MDGRQESSSFARRCARSATPLFLALLAAGSAHAQVTTYRIEGAVVDSSTQRPLSNVAVTIQGTSLGTLSDAAGRYVLAARVAPGTYTLLYSLIGRVGTSREITLGSAATLQVPEVRLRESAVELEGLVVTGTGVATQRRALGNAVSVVSGDILANARAATIDAALAGKVPGAQIMSNSGTPGGGVSVRLRGTSSIVAGAEPLYIIDGVIVDNSSDQQIDFGYRSNPSNRLADLNPNDIERIEVLKGAAAAALYGSRANNGVIQIFTKRGAAGTTRIDFMTRAALNQPQSRLPFTLFPFDTVGGPAERRFDHQDLIFKDAWSNETSASIAGGADQTRFFLSAGYMKDNGIMIGSDNQKISARLNVDQNVSSWFSVAGGANYVRSSSDLLINGEAGNGGILTSIVFTPTDLDLSAKNAETGQYVIRATTFPNPLEVIDFWEARQLINRFIGSFQAKATPSSSTSFEYRLGYDTYNMETSLYIPRGTPGANLLGSSTAVGRTQYLINNDLVASHTLAAGQRVRLTSAAGMNHTYSRERTIKASATDLLPTTKLVSGAVPGASQTMYETATLGFFGQEQVGLDDLFFVTGALRFDASSTFGPDERWQIFPKLSSSYVVSGTEFWKNSSLGAFMPDFRLRAALGYAGNQPPVASAYARFPRYRQETNITRLGLVHQATQGNPELKPERQRELEAGFDASFLGDRVGVSFTWYTKYVKDLLLSRPFEPSTGYGTVLDNVGEMSNKGIELQVTTHNIEQQNLAWNTTFTFSLNRNKVEKLVGDPFATGYFNWVYQDQPLGVWRLTDFVRDSVTGQMINDAAGLPTVQTAAQAKIVGDPNPDYVASLRNEFRLGRGLTASFLLDGVFGHDVWNQTLRIMDRSRAGPLYERQLRGEITDVQRLRLSLPNAPYLEDGTFVKIREVSLAYSLPQDMAAKLGARTVTLELSGRNLHTFTSYSGLDPETNMFGTSTVARGTDFANYPIPRSFSIGVRAGY